MYSKEMKEKAIQTWLKNGKCIAKTVRELEWLKVNTLRLWISDYNNNKEFSSTYHRKPKYSEEQRKAAVDYFLSHGRSIKKTVVALGYPCRYQLQKWLKEDCDDYSPRNITACSVNVTAQLKKDAVIDLCTSAQSTEVIAQQVGVTRGTLYNWKKDILDKGNQHSMAKKKQLDNFTTEELLSENERLKKELSEMEEKLYKAQLEYDILEKAAELIKKDMGINPSDQLSNVEKTIVIDALRAKYSLKNLLKCLKMAKSSYEYNRISLLRTNKYEKYYENIISMFNASKETYGYRRITSELNKNGIILSEKVVRKIMKELGLVVYVPKTKKNYSSYKGEISPEVENIINRDFKADEPYEKLLTDITEFSIPAGKVYLSPIIDCFDGLPVTWTIGTSPTAELANTMLDNLIKLTPPDKYPIVHSDRGCHYRWPGWIERMEKAGFTRSMSKKGCSPDNSACEGFFGRLKNEFFYNKKWEGISIAEFTHQLNEYIIWYGKSRIKVSLGGLSPWDYRQSLGYA